MNDGINNPEQEDKFTTKDKIVGFLLVAIIILEIIVLVITIKKDKESNYFEVKSNVKSYALTSNVYEGFPIELKCSDKQKIDIIVEKGNILSSNETLGILNDNTYSLTCEKDQIIYWVPDQELNNDEIANLTFKSDNTKYDIKEINIQKQENEYIIIK